ncbi:MAG: host-nuclease inhibitor Gam family protein [Magnetococcales bacterium]|nr:host-nuclease inhibitor Gam family protein [Magnetococcales bacterium]
MSVRKRIKPENIIHVRDLQQANAALGEIAQLARNLEIISADMNESIDRIKRASEAFAAPRRARLEALANGLSAFAEFHKATLFEKRRGIELTFGAFGFRRSSEVKPTGRGTWAQVLERIKELGEREVIRIREDVNRDALRAWSEERLALLGVDRIDKDVFWYEPKTAALSQEAARGLPMDAVANREEVL